MLAYYVEWHMRQALAPLLFDDDDKETAQGLRKSVVAPAVRSPAALRKAALKKTPDSFPVMGFQEVLKNLTTIVKDTMKPKVAGAPTFRKMTIPNRYQQHLLDLLGVRL
jgi:hypothetical protein